MRELSSHKVNGLNEAIKIEATDEPGAGNAHHKYRLRFGSAPAAVGEYYSGEQFVEFQNGPIAEVGINGISQ